MVTKQWYTWALNGGLMLLLCLTFAFRVEKPLAENGNAVISLEAAFVGLVTNPIPISERVNEVLRADEIVNRFMIDGGITFEIYVARWAPGNADYHEAYGHTPDGCWLEAGWKAAAGASGRTLGVGDVSLKPAEWRVFTQDGTSREVVFWCLLGSDLYEYPPFDREAVNTAVNASWKTIFRDARFVHFCRRLVGLSAKNIRIGTTDVPAYFVRLSTSASITDVIKTAAARDILCKLDELGVKLVQENP